MAQRMPTGTWTFAFECSTGYAAFSVAVSRYGRARITGVLPSGKKFSFSGQGVLADDGRFAIPVMDAKKGVAFVIWIDGDDGLTVSDVNVSEWEFAASGRLQDGDWKADDLLIGMLFPNLEVSSPRASYNVRNGVAVGSFKVSSAENGGKGAVAVKFSGVVVSGRLYATATMRGFGSFKLSTGER